LLIYFFLRLSGACVNADAATLFTLVGVLGFDSNFEAVVATFGDVFSFFAICITFYIGLFMLNKDIDQTINVIQNKLAN
jgi:hypothetical protein